MRRSLLLSIVVPVFSCVSAGCPGDAAGRDAGIGDSGSDDDDGGANGGEDAGSADAGLDLTRDPSCGKGAWIVQYSGSIVDSDAQPLEGAAFQFCAQLVDGRLICLQPAYTGADGAYELTIPYEARCIDSGTGKSVILDSDHAATYCHLDLDDDAPIQANAEPSVVFATTRAQVPALGDDRTTPRTVVFDDALEMDIVPDAFFGPYRALNPGDRDSYEELAATRLAPTTDGLCFLDAPESLEAVYAFSPEGDLKESTAALRIPNSTGLAADTVVDLYVLGGLSCSLASGAKVKEGDWVKFGQATVSSDGSVIEASGENGLPCINWFGYGVAPTE